LGQHFLVNARVLARIVDSVEALGADEVVELGAGAGALTFALLDRGFRVHALELDARMIDLLSAEGDTSELVVERSDLAQEDFGRFVGAQSLVFAGNLPYQITTPILFGLLPALSAPTVAGAVLMMQAEVAQRIVAPPGRRAYGVISVFLQAQLHMRTLFSVRPGSFLPPPAVNSAVVELRRRTDPIELGESAKELARELFSQRRKQIGGVLRRRYRVTPEQLESMPSVTGLRADQRPESMSPEDILRLDDWLRGRDGRA
jgi:16S rRNA (adenine1518-N6/adenine1519-N6)-dimethyltransferase